MTSVIMLTMTGFKKLSLCIESPRLLSLQMLWSNFVISIFLAHTSLSIERVEASFQVSPIYFLINFSLNCHLQ